MDNQTLARQVAANKRRIEDAIKLGNEGLSRGGASTTTLQAQITSNDSDIAALQSDVSTAQGDIATLQGDVSSNDTDISNLQSDVSTAQGDITTLQSDVSSNDTDISNLQSDVATNTAGVAANTSGLSNLQVDVMANSADILTLQGDLIVTDARTFTNQTQITTNLASINGLDARMVDVESSQVTEDWAGAGSLPGSPADGRIAWHPGSSQYCYYDATRARWLSFWKEDMSFADQVATGLFGFLKIEAIPTSGTFGHTWPYDVCITGGRGICANPTTGTVVLFSASHPSGAVPLAFGGSNTVSVTGANVLIPAGEIISSVATGATAAATSAIWFARRVFT
jgi:hypothetical protein